MPLLRFTESYSAALIFSTLVAGSNGCQLYERSSNDVRPDAAVSAVGSDAQGHDLFDAGSISQSSSDATLMVPTTDAAVGASGLTWSPKTATMFPPVDDTTPTLAYDTVRQQAVLFVELGWRVGGNSGDEDETWIWDGTTWAMHMPDH